MQPFWWSRWGEEDRVGIRPRERKVGAPATSLDGRPLQSRVSASSRRCVQEAEGQAGIGDASAMRCNWATLASIGWSAELLRSSTSRFSKRLEGSIPERAPQRQPRGGNDDWAWRPPHRGLVCQTPCLRGPQICPAKLRRSALVRPALNRVESNFCRRDWRLCRWRLCVRCPHALQD